MEKGTTLFLKSVLIVMGLPILAFCILIMPSIAKEILGYHPEYSTFIYAVLVVMYATAIPYYMALYQSFKLLNLIDANMAFSDLSVKALKNIKQCAYAISIMYTLIMPFFYILGEFDDAPGIILIGLILIFASTVIAFFAAILQKLLKDAIEFKSENDLTV
ncbi:MAG: DUF2975 domain-containing protein [Clostridiales bacterium]|jgi:hypothetical protein|nr:DUF2975 domain-containing protein [Clostridiales bacterium]